ncbi:MAG: hypothetical protein IIA63_01395 [Nitrospinae bacterium]|nr:hypothetical protein [Nitrospinota bacterium]
MKSNTLMVKFMGRMTQWFQATCRDTTPLISEMMDHTLPLGKRLRVRFHLAICGVCCFYKKQLETVRALARKLGGDDAPTQKDAALSEQAKARIKTALNKQN